MTLVTRRGALQGALATAATAAALGPSAAQNADNPIRLRVTGSDFQKIPLAVPDFVSATPDLAATAADISNVVRSDLDSSGLFDVKEVGSISSIDVPPNFAEFRATGLQALVAGEAALEADGRLGVRFRLWDVAQGDQMEQLKFLAAPNGWRRVAHKVADVVYSKLTGEAPYFDSRIVFVEERGPKDARKKRLAIMDADGANLAYLTTDADLVLTPRFSPVDQEITFISYRGGQPQVYLLNLRTERQEILGDFPGMTFAPRFSPDGKSVVMSLSRNGNTNIFVMDLLNRAMRPLTDSIGIDTAPSYSPDGSKIVFESDRGGTQQIYVMNSDGTGVTRITEGGGRYATPVWSPRGDQIAFTKLVSGQFHIGVMRSNGSDEKLLTSGFLVEGPTWSPNGRLILFFKEDRGEQGRPQLWSVDVTGLNERMLETPAGASDPAWSPLIQ